MADRYNKRGVWDMAVEELGIKVDGMRVCRLLTVVRYVVIWVTAAS